MQLEQSATAGARETTFYVIGDTGEKYTIHHKRHAVKHRRVWTCNCRNFTELQVFIGGICKHIEFLIYQQHSFPPVNNSVLSPNMSPNTPWPTYPTATYVASTPTSPTAKSIIEDIKKVLSDKSSSFSARDGENLWHILTALRGPDDGNDITKERTTARLRGVLGLRNHCNGRFIVNNEKPEGTDIKSIEEMQVIFPKVQYHFVHHYFLAIQALKALGYIE